MVLGSTNHPHSINRTSNQVIYLLYIIYTLCDFSYNNIYVRCDVMYVCVRCLLRILTLTYTAICVFEMLFLTLCTLKMNAMLPFFTNLCVAISVFK